MFSLHEKVVYPGHGVARINKVVEKKIGGKTAQFFELTFLNKDMTVLVPMNNATSVGIRRLSSAENISDVFKVLAEPADGCHDTTATNWNKRNKEYQCKLRSGNLQEICKIYRDLKHISVQKELSFGEKALLSQTEALLVEEISIVKNVEEDQAVEQLRSLICMPNPLGVVEKTV